MPEQAPPWEVVVPLADGTVSVAKREVETGRVQIALATEIESVIARETSRGRRVGIELPCPKREAAPSSSRPPRERPRL